MFRGDMSDTTTTPARFIREQVFRLRTQQEFADALGYEQPTISRFENGLPFSASAQRRIRELAAQRGVPWNNNWFFEVPAPPRVSDTTLVP
jgi:transcriptional regulator with XRE-family HTH domain